MRASACLQDTLPDSVVAKRIKKVPQLHLPCESWKLPSFFLLRIRHPKIARSLPTCQHSSQAASGRPLFLWSGAPALRRRAPRAVLDSSINASAVPCGGGALLGSTTRHLHSLQGRTLCVLHRVEPMKEDLTMSFVYIYMGSLFLSVSLRSESHLHLASQASVSGSKACSSGNFPACCNFLTPLLSVSNLQLLASRQGPRAAWLSISCMAAKVSAPACCNLERALLFPHACTISCACWAYAFTTSALMLA